MKTKKSFLLRIDPRLFQELEAWAAAEFRSVNAQVEFLLRDCVNRRRKALPTAESPGGSDSVAASERPLDSK